MIDEEANPKSSNRKKLTNNLIMGILQYLRPSKVGQCLILNKTINTCLSKYFQTFNISVGNMDNLIINKEEVKKKGEIKNIRISVKIKQEYNKKIFMMLQLHKNEKEKLGIIPLIYRQTQQLYIININSNKYSSLYFMLRSGNFDTIKFKVELVTRCIPFITVKEIKFSMLLYNTSK